MSTKKILIWIATAIVITSNVFAVQLVQAQDLFTWANFLEIVGNYKYIEISYKVIKDLPGREDFCQAGVDTLRFLNFEEKFGITEDALWEMGYVGTTTNGDITTYYFKVPMEYCTSGNSGGGGLPLLAYAPILLLIIYIIIRAILAAKKSGGKLKELSI